MIKSTWKLKSQNQFVSTCAPCWRDYCGCSLKERQRGIQGETERNWQAGGLCLPPKPVTCPLEQGTMQYSSSASQPVSQPCSQTGRIHPKGASPSFSSQSAPQPQHRSQTDPCLSNFAATIEIWSEGASSQTLPLTQRANAPLKMHILAAHLVYLMHMHHTSGTKRNDIASDTEHPSSDIQFRFLQEKAEAFFLPVLACRLNLEKVWKRYRTCWKTPIWMLVRQPSSYSHWLSPSPTKCEISSDILCESRKNWRNPESSPCYQ